MKSRKALICISLINTILLLYTAWIKYNPQSSACPSCGKTSFLPVSDVYIALSGAIACTMLIAFLFLSQKQILFNYLSVIIATVSAFTASFLQAVQFSVSSEFCYYCFISALLFYVIFIILIYNIIIKPFFDSGARQYQSNRINLGKSDSQ